MSGRVISGYRDDGTAIRGYRKTDRRQGPKRPLEQRIHALNERAARRQPTRWVPDVRLGFLLPLTLAAFVASGPHGIGVYVHRGFVQVVHGSADQCFALASEFFHMIARDRPAFTVFASVISSSQPGRRYGRYVTVVNGIMVVSGGFVEPRIYEPRAA